MENERYVVIMAGGKGERFWPASRLARPKHLLPIVGDQPMLTQTVERLEGMVPMENVWIVTNSEQAAAVREVCPQLPAENVVAEPVGRDTAAAVGLSTLLVKSRNPKATFAMLPADHVIHDVENFRQVLKNAFAAAEAEPALITVGIKPEFAATGYGYIHRGAEVSEIAGFPVYGVQAFREKPDAATAEAYLQSGEYYWNAGMFIWQVPVIENCFSEFTPELWKALSAIEKGLAEDQPLDALLADHYPGLQKISIDYAVMEKAREVRVLESRFDWDDVGEWPAVARHFPADDSGNVQRGDVVIQEASDNIVINDSGRLTAILGVDGLIVVQTPDATLVCPKDKAQKIKALVKELGKSERYRELL